MQIAIISDIHGNDVALDAVLADLERHAVDRVVCLGDAVQGGPQPAQVVSRLRALGCPVVMGNADAWLISGQDSGREPISPERQARMDVVREWMLSCLTPGDRAFIADFQPTVTIETGVGPRLLCFHGSPASFDDVILPTTPEDAFQRLLGGYGGSILTGGHTHLQQVRRLGDYFFFNPGSVGLAYSHQQEDEAAFRVDPWAEYAVLSAEPGRLGLDFRRVSFDVAELLRAYRAGGHPFGAEAPAQYGVLPD